MKHPKGKVTVYARFRPTQTFASDILNLLPDGKTINIHCPKDERQGLVNNQIVDWSFRVDQTLHNVSQEELYNEVAKPVVAQALDGYNGTVLCYGQTGAGKTFTMTGTKESYHHRGVLPRSLSHLFKEVNSMQDRAINVKVSYFEIYNEQLTDLLGGLPEAQAVMDPNVTTAVIEDENGVYVRGLSYHLVQNEEDALNLLFEGETNRAIGAHTLNRTSSRSHTVFTVFLECRSRVSTDSRYTTSKLNFVDLAGSERIAKTQSAGKVRDEAMYINKSLSFLEQVIIALSERNRDHIPFRQSKLTHYLKDSIGGKCSTVLVANLWGEGRHIEETISTLRFAQRMMKITVEAAVNERHDPLVMVRKLQEEVKALRQELAMHDTLTNRTMVQYEPLTDSQRRDVEKHVKAFADGQLDELDIVNIRQIQATYGAFKQLYQQVDKEVEARLRSDYQLMKKGEKGAEQDGNSVDQEMGAQGELDRRGFGIGRAPREAKAEPSGVVNAKKREAKTRKGKKDEDKAETPPATRNSVRKIPSQSGMEPSTIQLPSSAVEEKSNSPPPRSEAFEEFKLSRGAEIARILTENKEILASKRRTYAELAHNINTTKAELDESRMRLDQLKQERESDGFAYNDEGEQVITEDEFLEIKKLRDYKNVYKTNYDELKNLKSEVMYCQKLVDQCRQRLVTEFDVWYAESYQPDKATETSTDLGIGKLPGTTIPEHLVLDDEGERFENLQRQVLMEKPEEFPFHLANIRQQRQNITSRVLAQPQPHYRANKPGTPLSSLRNKHIPPQQLPPMAQQ